MNTQTHPRFLGFLKILVDTINKSNLTIFLNDDVIQFNSAKVPSKEINLLMAP